MFHADSQLAPAYGAEAAALGRLYRSQADAAVAVPVQVILPLLREKFDRPQEALTRADGVNHSGIGERGIHQVGLPPQLGGGVGVGVGDECEPIQLGDAPVHRRIGREPCLHRVDVRRQVVKALLDGVKVGECAKHGKVRRPDVRRDELGLRAGVQRQLEQIAAVETQDWPSVGVDVPDGLQFCGQLVRRLQTGQQDHVVHLARFAIALIDAADLPRYDEQRALFHRTPRQTEFVPQRVHPLARGDQLLFELLAPLRVGEVPSANHLDALAPCGELQVRGVAVLAGGTGKAGVYMQVGNVHQRHPLSN